MGDYISRDMAIAYLTKVEVTEKIPTMAAAKRAIADMPSADDVSREVYEQVRWERAFAAVAQETRAKVRELGIDEWYQTGYLCLNCGADIMVRDGEGYVAAPKRCPICEAKLELENGTPTLCDDCPYGGRWNMKCTICPRYRNGKDNHKEEAKRHEKGN